MWIYTILRLMMKKLNFLRFSISCSHHGLKWGLHPRNQKEIVTRKGSHEGARKDS